MLPPLRIEKKPLSFRLWAFPFRSSIRGLSVKSSLIVSWHDESYRPSQRRRGCGKEILDRKVHFEAFETYGFLVVESVDRDGRAFACEYQRYGAMFAMQIVDVEKERIVGVGTAAYGAAVLYGPAVRFGRIAEEGVVDLYGAHESLGVELRVLRMPLRFVLRLSCNLIICRPAAVSTRSAHGARDQVPSEEGIYAVSLRDLCVVTAFAARQFASDCPRLLKQ